MVSFNRRIAELQEMIITRNVNVSSSIADFAAVDSVVTGMEHQIEAIKLHLKEEAEALPRAQANLPPNLPGNTSILDTSSASLVLKLPNDDAVARSTEETKPQKERKGRGPPPRWYLTDNELDSLSSYMRGRLTLDKVNAAIDEMAQYSETNAQLIAAPRKKLGEDLLEKALELRDISTSEPVKGKYFFLEVDLKGPVLKLDNTGKSILTVLRHVGRVHEARIGKHRVLILAKPQ